MDREWIKIEELEPPDGLGRMLTTLFNEAAAEYEDLVTKFVAQQYERIRDPHVIVHPAILAFERKHMEKYRAQFTLSGNKDELLALFTEARALDEAGKSSFKTTMYFFAQHAINHVLEKRDFPYFVY